MTWNDYNFLVGWVLTQHRNYRHSEGFIPKNLFFAIVFSKILRYAQNDDIIKSKLTGTVSLQNDIIVSPSY